ncbi:hypothetical protein DYB28_015341 [Aphanomyces astaci]|uniref:Peptidase S1 domain-containing protein n=1 Tax=Aphanomyces astaci TaxID=112090 RepID=A0A3L6UZ27_APHAT|nr:hypothetical protein AaE_004560 [Aphanomyces astaci]RLO01666.1 hypothetical protein DYB28_015341 [Aphanomyces astaci]
MVKTSFLAIFASVAVAQHKIINGTEAPIGKYLYVTGLREKPTSNNRCGGILIAPKYVLTGTFCSDALAAYTSVGSHYLSGDRDGERLKVVKRIVHPHFNRTTNEYDFAILELESASKVTPVNVAFSDNDVVNATQGTVRGWGKFSNSGQLSPVLREGNVKIWSNLDCEKAVKHIGPVFSSMICAGGGDKDWCNGDHGAPLTVSKGGDDYVVGVASWGGFCASKNVPSVYARVSSARDFIQPYLPTQPTTTKPTC